MAESLDETTVRHVANLARLDLTADEVVRFREQLSSILGYVEQLNELNTDNVPPTAHALPMNNVFRDDTVQTCWDPGLALRNAPQCQDGCFKVPRVLDQGDA
jgi:aspartyl-tRNA(Asn)/glutamyl-tRNA(Gln) amidotransferase subunit C